MSVTGEKDGADPDLELALRVLDLVISNLCDPLDDRYHCMNVREVDKNEWFLTRQFAVENDIERQIRGYDPHLFQEWEATRIDPEFEYCDEDHLEYLFEAGFGGYESTHPVEMTGKATWGTVVEGALEPCGDPP